MYFQDSCFGIKVSPKIWSSDFNYSILLFNLKFITTKKKILRNLVPECLLYTLSFIIFSTNTPNSFSEPDPVYKFVRPLAETTEAYTTKDVVLECQVNDYKAIVTWHKDGSKIEVSSFE